MTEKPCFAEHAGPLGLGDVAVIFDVQFDVVANTPTKGTSGVFNDLYFRGPIRRLGGGHIRWFSAVGRYIPLGASWKPNQAHNGRYFNIADSPASTAPQFFLRLTSHKS